MAVAVCTLATTLVSIPHAIQPGDAGEFATVMLTGGVPHPPGYPFMRLLGLVSRLLVEFGVGPAMAAALPPALAGVGAWVVLHRVCARLGWPNLGAAIIVLVAGSPLVNAHVPDSEVWGPHLLFTAMFLLVALRSPQAMLTRTSAQHQAFWLGLVLGLAFCQHQTAIFLVPLAVGATVPGWEAARSSRVALAIEHAKLGLRGLAGVLVGFIPLVTLAVGSGGEWRWGDTQTAAGLLHHVLRADYGTTQLSLHEGSVAVSDTLARALASLGEVFSAGLLDSAWIGGLVLATASLAALPGFANPRWTRGLAIGSSTSLLVASLGFAALQNIDPTVPTGAWILERFDLMPLVLAVPLLAVGVGGLADRVQPMLARVRPSVLRFGASTIAIALVGAQFAWLAQSVRPATERAVEVAALDAVRTPDPTAPGLPDTELAGEPIRAIVFGTDDHRTFPILYVQSVLGEGRHTLYIDASLFTRPWYRAQLRKRFAELPEAEMPLQLIGALWSDPRFDDVPIYLANVFSRPASELVRVPEGMLWRVVPPADHPTFDPAQWTPSAIVDRHLAACERMAIRAADFGPIPSEAGSADPWASDLRFVYVEKAHSLVNVLVRSSETNLSARPTGPELSSRSGSRPESVPAIVDALRTNTGVDLGE